MNFFEQELRKIAHTLEDYMGIYQSQKLLTAQEETEGMLHGQ